MSTKILFRRDTAANWVANNPVLLAGEIGIETDTYKFKIGNGSRWNQQPTYAFKIGMPNGVAQLGSTGKIPLSQLPDSQSLTADLQSLIDDKFASVSTSSIAEGTNLYFTNQRAINAVGSQLDSSVSSAISTEITNRNSAIATAKTQAISTASNDATIKATQAKAEAISETTASLTNTIRTSIEDEALRRDQAITSAISVEQGLRNTAINTAISSEIVNRNNAINSTTTSQIAEGTNLYFTNQRAKNAVSGDISSAINSALASVSLSNKTTDDLAEGIDNKYFSDALALSATKQKFDDLGASLNQLSDDIVAYIMNNYVSNTNLGNQLGAYISESDRNMPLGFAGLNSSSQILESVIPSTIARTSDITSAINNIIDGAPTALNTLQELATSLANDQTALGSLTTAIGTKLSITDAANIYAPKASPTFTGTVSGITKYMVGLSNVDNTSDLNKPISTATQTALNTKAPLNSPAFTGIIDFSNVTVTGLTVAAGLPIQSTSPGHYLRTDGSNLYWDTIDLSSYAPLDNPTFTGYVSFNDSSVSFANGAITNNMLEGSISNDKLVNYSITINGNTVNLGGSITVGSYGNGSNPGASNKILYGTTANAPTGTYAPGDIYIQY